MRGDEAGRRPRAARRLAIGLAMTAIGLGGAVAIWMLATRSDSSSGSAAPARIAEPATAATAGAAASPRATAGVSAPDESPTLADGSLPPILGDPRLDRIDYCDERNWRRIDTVVRDVDGDALIVDEGAWLSAGASTRVGLAGWASKCRLDGRALVVRSAGSGHELGAYDPAFGYETLD